MSQVLGEFGGARFHHVAALSRLAGVSKLMNRLFSLFSIF
jgi:hypothetical protein